MKFFNDIQGKAALYAIPLFLTPFVDKMGPYWTQGNFAPLSMYPYCLLTGIIAACIGLRAFYDGSYERRKSGSDANDLPVTPAQEVKPTTPATPAEPTKPQ